MQMQLKHGESVLEKQCFVLPLLSSDQNIAVRYCCDKGASNFSNMQIREITTKI